MSSAHRRLATGIDGLDLILDGGFRYPKDGSLFLVILGGPGTGKTHLALELTVRLLAQPEGAGAIHLFYGLDQSPHAIHAKLSDDFGHYSVPGTWSQVSGGIQSEGYQALLHAVCADQPRRRQPAYFLCASVKNPEMHGVHDPTVLFEQLDRDIEAITRAAPNVGKPLHPRLVTIDNISLKTFDDGDYARHVISGIRNRLALRQMHGIFVVETPGTGADRATFAAAEYAADVIIQLGYHEFGDQFKERSMEIAKARCQFYFRGTHHFSIVGKSDDELRGARGQRSPGIHVYPSIPTLLSYMQYRRSPEDDLRQWMEFGFSDLQVMSESSNGLIGPADRMADLLRLTLRFLLAGGDHGLLVSFHQMGPELLRLADEWYAEESPRRRIHVISFEPEYISSGKFLKDVYDVLMQQQANGLAVTRAAVFGLEHLRWGFPLLHDSKMLIPWLTSFFKALSMTSLFVETDVTRSEESAIAATADNLFRMHQSPPQMEILRGMNACYKDGVASKPV